MRIETIFYYLLIPVYLALSSAMTYISKARKWSKNIGPGQVYLVFPKWMSYMLWLRIAVAILMFYLRFFDAIGILLLDYYITAFDFWKNLGRKLVSRYARKQIA